jgi:hypothetical protein
VLAAIDDGRKIGQIALVGQTVCVDGEICPAIQLVDLFILQAYRSAQLARRLYKEVERICAERNIRYILALPNDKSVLLNARLLKLSPLVWLPIRTSVSLRRPTPSKLRYSGLLRSVTRAQAVELLSAFACPATENGLRWDGDTLFDRLDDPTRDYAVHTTADLSWSRHPGNPVPSPIPRFAPSSRGRRRQPAATTSTNWSARPAASGRRRCSSMPAPTPACRNCRGLACPPGCGDQFSFSCAISAPRPTLCTSTASS